MTGTFGKKIMHSSRGTCAMKFDVGGTTSLSSDTIDIGSISNSTSEEAFFCLLESDIIGTSAGEDVKYFETDIDLSGINVTNQAFMQRSGYVDLVPETSTTSTSISTTSSISTKDSSTTSGDSGTTESSSDQDIENELSSLKTQVRNLNDSLDTILALIIVILIIIIIGLIATNVFSFKLVTNCRRSQSDINKSIEIQGLETNP